MDNERKWWEPRVVQNLPNGVTITEEPMDPRIVALLKKLDPETRCHECLGLGYSDVPEIINFRIVFGRHLCGSCNGSGVKNGD